MIDDVPVKWVVVPEFIVNVLGTTAPSVPAIFIVPAAVLLNDNCPAVPENVSPAVVVSVPVPRVMAQTLPFVALPFNVMPAAERVCAPIAMVVVPLLLTVEHVRVLLNVKLPPVMVIPVVRPALLIVILAAATTVDMVMTCPEAMVIVSPAMGPPETLQPLADVHVVEVVQSPV